MSIKWPSQLVGAVARRRAVILIGSGVSANATAADGRRPPTWGKFLESAYKRLGKRVSHIQTALSTYHYLEACDFLKQEHASEWESVIREAFVTPQFRPADIHQAIFDLDCKIVASLNFDRIYETYANSASEGTVIVKNYYDSDVRQVVAGYDRYILKPHGTVDTVSKMIFTLEDYARARINYAPFYEMMTALLHTHVFICIGCGLSDPDMKLIFEEYRYKHGESPHYMTLPQPFSSPEAEQVRRTRGLNVLQYSPRDGHKELTQSIQSLADQAAGMRDDIALLQNW